MASLKYERNVQMENITEKCVRRQIERFLEKPDAKLVDIEKYEISGVTTYHVYIQCNLHCYIIRIPAHQPESIESNCIDIDLIAKFLSCQDVRERLWEMYGLSIR